jgi:prepilin-type N-terminal cleavage/methylation domain-containing protein/prepilin-type processing-associated H-X9-DG protein
MIPAYHSRVRRCGFTLVEVLVTVGIVCVLAALLVPVAKNASGSADRTSCLARLAAYGKAVAAYANDNDQALPGPIYAEMSGLYGNWAPTRLQSFIAPYLGLPEASTLAYSQKLQCPAFLRTLKTNPQDWGAYSYVLNKQVSLDGSTNLNPWGNPSGNPAWGSAIPLRFPVLAGMPGGLSATWMMQDFDGTGAPLPTPVHKGHRNRLFFDLHVESVPVP